MQRPSVSRWCNRRVDGLPCPSCRRERRPNTGRNHCRGIPIVFFVFGTGFPLHSQPFLEIVIELLLWCFGKLLDFDTRGRRFAGAAFQCGVELSHKIPSRFLEGFDWRIAL